MSPTTRSSSGGIPSPTTPATLVGGLSLSSPSTPKRKRTSTDKSGRSGVSSSPVSPSKRRKRESTAAPTLETIPTELLNLIISELGLPCCMPVCIHTYGDDDNQLACKVFLPEGSEKAVKWRTAIAFGTVSKTLKDATLEQLQSMIRAGSSHLEVHMSGDGELETFPDIKRAENKDLQGVNPDILDEFREIKILVPLRFTNQFAKTEFLLMGRFTFRFGKDDRQFWEMDEVELAPMVVATRPVPGGPMVPQSVIDMIWTDFVTWAASIPNIGVLDLFALIRVLNEDFRDAKIENAIMGRGLSRDLLTIQCALAKMAAFANDVRKREPDDGTLKVWVLQPLLSGVRYENSARRQRIITNDG